MAEKIKDDPLVDMRKRYEACQSAWGDKFEESKADLRFTFIPGEQWDADMKAKRGKRPMYEFNKTRPVVKSVTNDMRQSSAGIKIRATQDGHQELADIMQGLIRNIEAQSRADTAYDTAGFFSAGGGYGVIEITTDYSSDDGFEQDIRIKEKRNPFAITFDPAAREFDKRDARYAFEEVTYTREAFKAKWPDADPVDFNPGKTPESFRDWFTEKSVRVARYWCKHPTTKTIYQLSDGKVLDEDDYRAIEHLLGQAPMDEQGQSVGEPVTLKSQRVVKTDKIEVSIVSGKEVLEGPFEWPGKFIPLVPVWGEIVNLDGEEHFSGIARPIKDAQRLFNWDICVGQEVMANQPRSPYILTAKMVEGYETAWKNLAVDNAPAIFYNPDDQQPGGPRREMPPNFPAGFFQSAQFAADLIKSVSNVVDAPIQSRAASGKAIQAVENQQDVGNFDYIDNLARAKAFVGEILVDLIPRIYDTERQIMILGEDGKESYKKLNESVQGPDGQWQVINDLSQGKYAVSVTIGQSYATQRLETMEFLGQMMQNPQLSMVAADLFAKNSDIKGAAELEKRLRKMGIRQGFIDPGEGDEQPQQQGPSPEDMANVELIGAKVEDTKASAAKKQAETAQLVQAMPHKMMQEAARAEMSVADAYTKDPTTPYWGAPQQELPPQ